MIELLADMTSLDRGVTIGVLSAVGVGIAWLAKVLVPPWVKSIVERNERVAASAEARDKKIAEDNASAIKQRERDIERWGEERREVVDALASLAELPAIIDRRYEHLAEMLKRRADDQSSD